MIAGLPKVWQLTLRELGMDEAQIRAFIPDLAATAWWAMGNLEGTGGPVPKEVVERDAALGRFLVREMRALGIARWGATPRGTGSGASGSSSRGPGAGCSARS